MKIGKFVTLSARNQATWTLSPVVMLPPMERRPETVTWFKDKYHLSWSLLAAAMGYRSISSAAEVANGTAPITDQFWDRFLLAVAKLTKEHGHWHTLVVTEKARRENPNMWNRLPRNIRIAVPLTKCLGHREPCILDPRLPDDQKFCSDECRELYEKRKRRS